MLRLPAVDRALWHSAHLQAHLMTAAAAGHRYAAAAVDGVGAALVTLSLAGSLYLVTGLARRLAALGRRWSGGRPGRRLQACGAGLAVMAALAAFWILQDRFRGWCLPLAGTSRLACSSGVGQALWARAVPVPARLRRERSSHSPLTGAGGFPGLLARAGRPAG